MHLDHISTTLLYFSPLVINPSEYCFSYPSICFFVLFIKFSLVLGINKSSLPKEIPALNACLKPNDLILSQKITVSFCPQNLKIVSITSETFFLVKSLLIRLNLMFLFFGKTFASKNLPAVLVYFSTLTVPSSLVVSNIEMIFECRLIELFSKACSISSTPEKIPFGFLSFSSACDR